MATSALAHALRLDRKPHWLSRGLCPPPLKKPRCNSNMGARTPIALGTNNIETLETPSLIQNVTTVDRMYVINGASVASSYVLKGATVASFYVLFRATVAPTSLSQKKIPKIVALLRLLSWRMPLGWTNSSAATPKGSPCTPLGPILILIL